MAKRFEDIDAYVASCPEAVRPILQRIRRIVAGVAPLAVEAIRYDMPTFKTDKGNLVHFAAWKKHIAVYPGPSGTAEFNERLAPFVGDKGTVRFPLAEPLPYDLIEDLVRFRMAELDRDR